MFCDKKYHGIPQCFFFRDGNSLYRVVMVNKHPHVGQSGTFQAELIRKKKHFYIYPVVNFSGLPREGRGGGGVAPENHSFLMGMAHIQYYTWHHIIDFHQKTNTAFALQGNIYLYCWCSHSNRRTYSVDTDVFGFDLPVSLMLRTIYMFNEVRFFFFSSPDKKRLLILYAWGNLIWLWNQALVRLSVTQACPC